MVDLLVVDESRVRESLLVTRLTVDDRTVSRLSIESRVVVLVEVNGWLPLGPPLGLSSGPPLGPSLGAPLGPSLGPPIGMAAFGPLGNGVEEVSVS